MKATVPILCVVFTILLLALVLPVAATPTISSVSPSIGYRGDSVTVTIKGSDFDLPSSSSYKYIRLWMEDESNITASSITSSSTSTIKAKFSIGSSKEKGVWSVVVVNDDDSEYMLSDCFTITDEMVVSSISPTSAQTNNDDADFTLTGSGLSDVAEVYLYNKNYNNITTTDFDIASSTKITGTFDLDNAEEVTYKVCTMDSEDVRECSSSVTFEVTTDEVGELDITTSPSGASVYLDSTYMGTTPYTNDEIIVGSHVVKISLSGYTEISKIVKITEGDTTSVDQTLSPIATTVITTVPTTIPTTVKTVIPVTTIKIPTTYPKTTTVPTTTASPVDTAGIIGAVAAGLGLMAIVRRH